VHHQYAALSTITRNTRLNGFHRFCQNT